jgi:signal transduction histidine kinase
MATTSDDGGVAGPVRPLVRSRQSLHAALWLVVAGATVVTGLETVVLFAQGGSFIGGVVFYALIGLAYVAVGAVVWRRRPSNRVGMLLCVIGVLIMVASLDNVNSSVLEPVCSIVGSAPIPAVMHLMLAYPSGRLRAWVARLLVVANYVVTIGLQIPAVLYSPPPEGFSGLRMTPRPDVVHALATAQHDAAAALAVAAAVVVWRRLRAARAGSGERPILSVVYGYGVFALVFFPLSVEVVKPLLGLSVYGLFLSQIIVLAGIPFVFAGGILFGGIARSGALEELGVWLANTGGARLPLRDALADTLGDRSLQLVFAAGPDSFVDHDGRSVDLATVRPPRAAVTIQGPDGPVGSVIYDAELIADPTLVATAGRVVALAIERERLTAELLASQEALRESRTRIVEVGDRERRRVAQDLHDLLQGRLILAALHAGQLAVSPGADGRDRAAAVQLRAELDAAITSLRRQVHGLMPALLIERGVGDAVRELGDHLPIPAALHIGEDIGLLPPAVATTGYFIVAEALTNTVRHSGAAKLAVRVERVEGYLVVEVVDDGTGGAVATGAGLRGMADRVDALGGTLEIDSPAGGGTRICASLPCA